MDLDRNTVEWTLPEESYLEIGVRRWNPMRCHTRMASYGYKNFGVTQRSD
jgi:hypothetical protein